MYLIEMSNLRKVDTRLPVNLWIDEANRSNHSVPRIKFQNNTSDRFTKSSDLIPISVEEEPKVLLKNFSLKISKEEFNAVVSFISLNKEAILRYMNDPSYSVVDYYKALKRFK